MAVDKKVIRMHDSPLLAAALAYATRGWHILPAWWAEKSAAGTWHCACGNAECKSPAKHPIGKLAPWGQNSASTDSSVITKWWTHYPQANIAVYLEPSELCAVDIDPRNGGLQTIEDIEAKHGLLVSELTQFTGGGGEHRIFQLPKNTSLPGKLGSGVDLKVNGYIMLEPSNHVSGGFYAWEVSSDPRDGIYASPMPDWMRDLAAPKPLNIPEEPTVGRVMPIGEDVKTELIQALSVIPSDERDTWLKVGMALHSIGDPNWTFDIWDRWSAQSHKYDHVDQIRVWRSFKGRGLDGITYKSIFGLAKQLGTVIRPESQMCNLVVAGEVQIMVRKPEEQPTVGSHLLTPPGILADVVNWINSTSPKPQPQFAVQTAIAFASTVLGRRFTTNHCNWPSLYLLNIGLSASGKEYAKTALERLLEACGLTTLLGPSGYSSDAGMLSSLYHQPSHCAVVDEFHRVLEQASVKGNARAQGMVRALIEVWGRTDGTMRSVGYSTVGLKSKEIKALQERSIVNPALTVLAMAVPTFWETIGSAAAKDGFLNRFLIVESNIGRQVGQFNGAIAVPQTVIDWTNNTRARYTGIVDTDNNPMRVTPIVVPINVHAMALFDAFAKECLTLMDQHEDDGLAEMFGRSNEIAMKLALILALARSALVVEVCDAEWAIDYVKTYALRTTYRLKTCMADGVFEAAKKQVLNLLIKAGERGMTPSEINRHSRAFRGMTQRQQTELLNSLAFLNQVRQMSFGTQSGKGRPRVAWVAIEEGE
jgi:hypothetical protein